MLSHWVTGILFLIADCRKFYAHCAYEDEVEEELEEEFDLEIEQLKKEAQKYGPSFNQPHTNFPVTIAKSDEINNYIWLYYFKIFGHHTLAFEKFLPTAQNCSWLSSKLWSELVRILEQEIRNFIMRKYKFVLKM